MSDLEALEAQIVAKDAEIAKLAKEVEDLKSAPAPEPGPHKCPKCHAEFSKNEISKDSDVIPSMQEEIAAKDGEIAKLTKEVADLKSAAPAKRERRGYPFSKRTRAA